MFDRIAAPRPRRSRWISLAISASVLGHLAAGGALLMATLWQVDKLAVDRPGTVYVAAAGLPGPVGDPPPPPAPAAAETVEKVATDEITQPDPGLLVVEDTAVSTGPASADGEAGGHPDGVAGGTGKTPFGMNGGGGGGGGDAIDRLERRDPPEPEQPVEPEIVPPGVIEGRLLSGNTHIEAPDSVRVDMLHAGLRQLVGTFKLCIDARGHVSGLSIIATTDYPAYDHKLMSEMKRWRYVPYEIGGEPVPVCTAITVVYRLID
jgi:periplasmic protein TonB